MAQSALVLGGGMVGVCTAWHLRERGYDVTLVERGTPGRETSYGNAGLIQREAVEPYAFPHDVLKLAQVALQRGNDVSYRLRDLLTVAPKLAQYWWNSFPSRYQGVVTGYEALIRHCLSEHDRMISASGADNLISRQGWKQIFRTQKGFDAGAARSRLLTREFGIESRILDPAGLAREEPALKRTMAGAVHWTSPYSVSDPGGLVDRYAALLTASGGRILKGDARSLRPDGAGWCVDTREGTISAEQAVITLGPWSDVVTRMLGYRLPLFVKRGYHRHFGWQGTLNTPMIDTEAGVAMLPMALGLRVTTGAEFALRDAPLSMRQIDGSERLAREMLDLGAPVEARPWLGSRPCTVDMLPLVGQAPSHRGLWFHFGHAHQGFTLGPATARLCAGMMNGEAPYIDPSPYRPSRFGRAAQV
ncbi:NAD(P)/FAD-dependent oxidoreductase [Acetobacter oeni]|uniref:Oxidoreductase n=1 Tax=Acetobacter oeni TaxID=304077 RepID=A0A511XPX5_9PROT|nr:FAD-binding oxidoreductase [Acetobacter oeni]MBB3883569.1 D-amino-acid dehydrogenase [Acetobacter oeni]NHO19606.1 FAD-dependent oxidoreductase [Acetobacter oeni]GEN64946.1 oxidoreductase [Acetobacter oeni]